MPTHKIRVSYKRAKGMVFPPLLDAYRLGLEPYDKPLVQDKEFLPPNMKWGSREHALWLWALDYYMKGAINSPAAIQLLSKFYSDHPEVFMPENFETLEPQQVEWVIGWLGQTLPKYGLGVNINETKEFWIWNLLKLNKFWKNDPRLLFDCTRKDAERSWHSFRIAKRNYDRLCSVLIRSGRQRHKTLGHQRTMSEPNGFYGYAHKMVSMLAYFYIHALMILGFAYPVPVDFHILRVLIQSYIIRLPKHDQKNKIYRESVIAQARDISLRYIVETGTKPEHLADALWLLSRSFCRWHPGNKSSVEKTRKARKRDISHEKFIWTHALTRRYENTCGQCKIQGLCKWNMPSSYYYVKGTVHILGMRELPHQLPLHEIPVKTPPVKVQKPSNGKKEPDIRQLSVFD